MKRPKFRDCVVCGETFEIDLQNRAAKACGAECSKEARRQYDQEYKQRNRVAINASKQRAYSENPEPFQKANRRHYRKNREAILASNWEREKANRASINARRRARYAQRKAEAANAD